MSKFKEVLGVYESRSSHWVGDGFHVRNLIPSTGLESEVSPFLLLDYAGPTYFPPSENPRGVGEHPHSGIRGARAPGAPNGRQRVSGIFTL